MSLNKPIKYLFFYSTFPQPFFRRSQPGNQKAPSTTGERFSYSLCFMPLPPAGTYTHKSDTTKNHYIYITI